MGHSSITITLDRYGHLMPGNEDGAAGLLDAYLAAEEGEGDERVASRATRSGLVSGGGGATAAPTCRVKCGSPAPGVG
jgi:hypothetical protein